MKCLKTEPLIYWSEFDYSQLNDIETISTNNDSYNNIIIMADTETSKSRDNIKQDDGKWDRVENHVCCWSVALLYKDHEYVMYGRRPSEFIDCMEKIHENMPGGQTFVYFHNLAYDYQFLRLFFLKRWGMPENQLNIKPLYPLYVEYSNGITIKDSLMLAQRKLEKWAEDLDVIHKKAVGSWDYDKIRQQNTELTTEELLYIQNDVLAGVECLSVMCDQLSVNVGELPLTNTGIVRRDIKAAGKKAKANKLFHKLAACEELNDILEKVYHGGYTHGNRDAIGHIRHNVSAYDFSSSYPYVILSEKFPLQRFQRLKGEKDAAYIIRNSEDYAFVFQIFIKEIKIKDEMPMPSISREKCECIINGTCDNGRVLEADFLQTYMTEQELITLFEQYDVGSYVISNVWTSKKDYLPSWLCDKVYEYFTKKTQLKDGDDPVLYQLYKGMLNTIYGLMCEHTCRDQIVEDYETGKYSPVEGDYNRYFNSWSNVLLYQWGVYITAAAQRNLFELGKCCREWLYCDTDSVYGIDWDIEALEAYNNTCREKLKKRGYVPVLNEQNGKYYELGVAEFDGLYSEFKCLGAKRYCCRYAEDEKNKQKEWGKLKITVAGVPKKTGAACLHDDMENFREGFVFSGEETGKKTHYYIKAEEIHTDADGNECGDSVDLVPCDYKLDRVYTTENWNKLLKEEVKIQVYE